MPYGREQLIYRLTPVGESLGLSVSELGRQLRTAFDGRLVQIYQDGEDEVEVRVSLPAEERGQLATLGEGDTLEISTNEESGFLLFGGLALKEPVAHYGPFVMNTQAEIDEAVADYREGRLVRNPVALL